MLIINAYSYECTLICVLQTKSPYVMILFYNLRSVDNTHSSMHTVTVCFWIFWHHRYTLLDFKFREKREYYYHYKFGVISVNTVVIFFHGCVSEVVIPSYSVSCFIYIQGKPWGCFYYYYVNRLFAFRTISVDRLAAHEVYHEPLYLENLHRIYCDLQQKNQHISRRPL